jgi:hypothetical protein
MSTLLPDPKATRESTITSMCYTWDHSYGLEKRGIIDSGFTAAERKVLWDNMAQIYDNDITPTHTLKG